MENKNEELERYKVEDTKLDVKYNVNFEGFIRENRKILYCFTLNNKNNKNKNKELDNGK